MTGISQTVNEAAGFQIPFSDNETTLLFKGAGGSGLITIHEAYIQPRESYELTDRPHLSLISILNTEHTLQ